MEQIKFTEILNYIKSQEYQYPCEIYCRKLTITGDKIPLYFRLNRFANDLSDVKKWMDKTDNYTSFYLNVLSQGVIIEQFRIDQTNV